MVKVTVSSSRKIGLAPGLPDQIEITGKSADEVTVVDVKAALAKKYPKVGHTSVIAYPKSNVAQLYVARQKLSLKDDKKPLSDESTLASAGVSDGGEVVVKDLGPQISWRTVFMVEYVRVSFSSTNAVPLRYDYRLAHSSYIH